MSIQFLSGKLQGEERKEIIQEVQKHLQKAAIGAIRPLLTEFCEQEVTAKLGREPRSPRRVSGQGREIDWQCAFVAVGMRTNSRVMGIIGAR